MATKQKSNMFSAAVQQREQEQQLIEETVTGKVAASSSVLTGKLPKRGNNATTITLSVSLEDKIKVKQYAAGKGMSVSDLFHRMVENLYKSEE